MLTKRITKIGISFIVIFILIFQVTVIPISGKEKVENFDKQSKKDYEFESFNNFYELTSNMNPDWIIFLLEFLYDLLEDDDFLDAFYYNKGLIIDFIYSDFQNLQLAEDFFDVEKTFSVQRIIQDIQSLRNDYFLEDFQDLIMTEDNLDNFIELYDEKASQAAELSESNEIDEEEYSKISMRVKKIGEFSRRWADPIKQIFPLWGNYIAAFITMLLFWPFLMPCWYYIAWCELAQDHPDWVDEPFKNLGKIVVSLYKDRYVRNARRFIYNLILISQMTEDSITFSEVAPTCNPKKDHYEANKDRDITFSVDVVDLDKIYSSNIYEYRDYVQAGFDWDNDYNIDTWTKLETQIFMSNKITIDCNHKFSSKGTKYVNVVARDQWGVESDWKQIKVEVKGTTSKGKINENCYFEQFILFQKIFRILKFNMI